MITNKQIKNKEIYKTKQQLLKLRGLFKEEQHELLLALNEMALSEIKHYNVLKQGVVNARLKSAIRTYINRYGEITLLEEHLQKLFDWSATDE